jgi:hypothetical protein
MQSCADFTANAVNPNRRQPTEIEQRDAENKLASTAYYRRNLQNRPGTVVQAQRDCIELAERLTARFYASFSNMPGFGIRARSSAGSIPISW